MKVWTQKKRNGCGFVAVPFAILTAGVVWGLLR